MTQDDSHLTFCDRCSSEIEFSDISKCEKCGWDGLCTDCCALHECDGDDEQD